MSLPSASTSHDQVRLGFAFRWLKALRTIASVWREKRLRRAEAEILSQIDTRVLRDIGVECGETRPRPSMRGLRQAAVVVSHGHGTSPPDPAFFYQSPPLPRGGIRAFLRDEQGGPSSHDARKTSAPSTPKQ